MGDGQRKNNPNIKEPGQGFLVLCTIQEAAW